MYVREPENPRWIVGLSDILFDRVAETGRLLWWVTSFFWSPRFRPIKPSIHAVDLTSLVVVDPASKPNRASGWNVCPWDSETYVDGADLNFRVKHTAQRDAVMRTIE